MIRLSVEGSRWRASGSLGADACASFRELLLLAESAAPAGEPRELDLAGVESIDVKGVQVLAAFVTTSRSHRLCDASDSVKSLLTRLGALSLLDTTP
ncbi:MAG TPA: STAS domain-containing protein [Polyangiaceae bacterium]|nr:STAS domain-containing protein [Polyangiaceae bacterium]